MSASVAGMVIAIIALMAAIRIGTGAEAASISQPALRAPAVSGASPVIDAPRLTTAQVADAARWTALAESLATTPGPSAAQAADAARWTALAESLATTPGPSAAQAADAARWTALAESFGNG